MDNISEAQTDYIYTDNLIPADLDDDSAHHAQAPPSDTTVLLAHSISQEPMIMQQSQPIDAPQHRLVTEASDGARRVGFEEHTGVSSDGPSDGEFENQENREPLKLHRR